MNQDTILALLEEAPVIAAIKDDAGLQACLQSNCKVVFILYGNVLDIPAIVQQVHSAGKTAIVHLDLIDGLATRDIAVDYIARATLAKGIISTRATIVHRAMELHLLAIRRFFLLDSIALQSLQKQALRGSAHMVEVLPGTMPKTLRKLTPLCPLPLIAGGLIADKEDVVAALSAGAVAVSTSTPEAWSW